MPATGRSPMALAAGDLHKGTQVSTEKKSETSCQENGTGIFSRQIEPGKHKNFAAQLKEGARTERLMRPRFFLPERKNRPLPPQAGITMSCSLPWSIFQNPMIPAKDGSSVRFARRISL